VAQGALGRRIPMVSLDDAVPRVHRQEADMMFRFLGRVAAVEEALRRRSVLFVPANYVVLAVLCVLVAAGVAALATNPAGHPPRRVTIGELAAGVVPAGSYVTVEGNLDPNYRIEVTTRTLVIGRRPRSSTQRTQFGAFVDDAKAAGILMVVGPRAAGWRRMTVTGIVHSLPTAASEVVRRESAMLPTRVHSTLMLVGGDTPMSRGAATAALATGLAILLVGCIGGRTRVAFREDMGPAPVETAPGHDGGPIDMRISATLHLANGASRRFVEARATAVITNQGDVAVGTDLDASIHLLGLRIRKRAGFWHVVLPAGGIEEITRGDVAFGRSVRPALELKLAGARRPALVLSFGAADQRERFLRALAHQCGLGARHAA
jgi:hypothetical protein